MEAAGARYTVEAADSFRLGETLRLVAFPGGHTDFEAPPLASGRRARGPNDAEVGLGLADALGLRPGSTLAAQLPSGEEVRYRVSGVVRALENQGRIAWVSSGRLLAASPDLDPALALRLEPGADRAAVDRALAGLGAAPQSASAATTRNGQFLAVLAGVLRGVGLAVGLVCLYALVQALAMTARERRGAVALLRACGGDARTVALVLGARPPRSRSRRRSPAWCWRRPCSARWSPAWRRASPRCRSPPLPVTSPSSSSGCSPSPPARPG